MYPKEKWSCEAGGYEDRFHWMKRIKLCSATIIVVPALWYLHHFFLPMEDSFRRTVSRSPINGIWMYSIPSDSNPNQALDAGGIIKSLMSISWGSPNVGHKLKVSQSKKPETRLAVWEVSVWVKKLVRGNKEERNCNSLVHRRHPGNFRCLRLLPSRRSKL